MLHTRTGMFFIYTKEHHKSHKIQKQFQYWNFADAHKYITHTRRFAYTVQTTNRQPLAKQPNTKPTKQKLLIIIFPHEFSAPLLRQRTELTPKSIECTHSRTTTKIKEAQEEAKNKKKKINTKE